MKKSFVLRPGVLLLAVCGLLFLSSNALAAPSIVNGSFEADPFSSGGTLDLGGANPLTGWTTLHNGVYPWGLPNSNIYNAGPTPYGNQWVIVGNFSQGGTAIQQEVPGFTVGQSYTLGFALASELPGREAPVEVSFPSGSSTLPQVFLAPMRGANYWDTWGTFSKSFVANSTTVTIRFAGLPPDDGGIDNVSLAAPTEPCTTVVGSGQFRPNGEVETVDNEVEVGGGKHVFEYSWESRGRHLRLTKLESSECTKSPTEAKFTGHGTANVNGVKGYEITFTFTQAGGKTNLVLVLEKGGVPVRTFTDEPLIQTKLQKEKIF